VTQAVGDPATEGRRALAERRWADAREAFERALADGAGPEALEGLSWAAWWLSDAEATLDARARAFRVYREAGAPEAAARMAGWLAWDSATFRGDLGLAAGWLARAHRLIDHLDPGADHGWVALHEGGLALAAGDTETARRAGADAARIGAATGVEDLEMVGLALEGAAVVAEGDVRAGMRRLEEASAAALAGAAELLVSPGWACCYMITACECVRDYERAAEWCRRGQEFALRNQVPFLLGVCRAEYADVLLWRGEWGEAERELEAAIELLSATRPGQAGEPVARLAELRRRQGRRDEARSLLAHVDGHPQALLVGARLTLDGGDAAHAAELGERYLRRVKPRNLVARAVGLELLVHARVAAGARAGATEAAAELERVAETIGTKPLRALAHHARGRVLSAAGEHDAARRHLEDAVDLLAQDGAAYETALARLDLAAALAALGRGGAAQREASAARAQLRALGAAAGGGELSAREDEVLTLVAEGLTNREIAERLVLSEHTVHRHVANIMAKLGVRTRAAAAARRGP
jgi:DNA-binding NarL/FixJ family response regulator